MSVYVTVEESAGQYTSKCFWYGFPDSLLLCKFKIMNVQCATGKRFRFTTIEVFLIQTTPS